MSSPPTSAFPVSVMSMGPTALLGVVFGGGGNFTVVSSSSSPFPEPDISRSSIPLDPTPEPSSSKNKSWSILDDSCNKQIKISSVGCFSYSVRNINIFVFSPSSGLYRAYFSLYFYVLWVKSRSIMSKTLPTFGSLASHSEIPIPIF